MLPLTKTEKFGVAAGVVGLILYGIKSASAATAPAGPQYEQPATTTPQVYQSGAVDPVVSRMQTELAAMGYAVGPVDGRFGTQTQTAMHEFQGDYGIPQTLIFDDATRNAIDQNYMRTHGGGQVLPVPLTTVEQGYGYQGGAGTQSSTEPLTSSPTLTSKSQQIVDAAVAQAYIPADAVSTLQSAPTYAWASPDPAASSPAAPRATKASKAASKSAAILAAVTTPTLDANQAMFSSGSMFAAPVMSSKTDKSAMATGNYDLPRGLMSRGTMSPVATGAYDLPRGHYRSRY